MPKDNDLTEYEKIRLENIRRNAEFLQSIGLSSAIPPDRSLGRSGTSNNIREESSRRKRDRVKPDNVVISKASRHSRRLSKEPVEGQEPEDELQAVADDEKENISSDEFYSRMPEVSEDLDDCEFEAYMELRKWRLKRCLELDLELFKIFHNRTMFEMIRRRRNNPTWGKGEDFSKELVECWGIGPSKARPEGFGAEALVILDTDEVVTKLEASRKKQEEENKLLMSMGKEIVTPSSMISEPSEISQKSTEMPQAEELQSKRRKRSSQ